MKNADVTIYNALGEKIYSTILPHPDSYWDPKGALNEINLEGQPAGLYLYRVVAENGELIGNGKFIIE